MSLQACPGLVCLTLDGLEDARLVVRVEHELIELVDRYLDDVVRRGFPEAVQQLVVALADGCDKLPVDRRDQVISELTAHEADALARKGKVTAQTARALEHAVRALTGGVGRAHLVSRRMPGSLSSISCRRGRSRSCR